MNIPTGFINKRTGSPRARRYVVYVPHDYDPAKAWPHVLFLHGSGERGNDGLRQTEIGLPSAIRTNPDRFPCLVCMPQCPEKVWWDAAFDDIDAALAQTISEYTIDKSRIYLTGISMGGYATWIYGARHATQFAALMPVCGGGEESDAPSLAKIPIWAFHGGSDDVVLPSESRTMVELVKQAGGLVKYTEFEGVGHNSWDLAYKNPTHIRWLLAQRRP